MSVLKLQAFISLVDALVKLLKIDEDKVNSFQIGKRSIAMKTIEFMTPKVRDIFGFYLRIFLNEPHIKTHPAYLGVIKNEVMRIREIIPLELPKKYAKQLKVKLN